MKASRCLTAAVVVMSLGVAMGVQAQTQHKRHESSVSKKFHLQHVIEDTYTHKYEAAVGGGLMRFTAGPTLRRDNQIDWATSLAYYLNPKYAIVGDIRGHYGDVSLPNAVYVNGVYTPTYGQHPLVTEYTFLAGPQWRFYRAEKYSMSAHVLAGMSMGNFDGGSKAIPAPQLGMWPDSNSAAAADGGVNFDYNFYPNLAFRATPYVLYTHFGGANQVNKGVNFQIVFRFGRQ